MRAIWPLLHRHVHEKQGQVVGFVEDQQGHEDLGEDDVGEEVLVKGHQYALHEEDDHNEDDDAQGPPDLHKESNKEMRMKKPPCQKERKVGEPSQRPGLFALGSL